VNANASDFAGWPAGEASLIVAAFKSYFQLPRRLVRLVALSLAHISLTPPLDVVASPLIGRRLGRSPFPAWFMDPSVDDSEGILQCILSMHRNLRCSHLESRFLAQRTYLLL
jgi:hypothetical protein